MSVAAHEKSLVGALITAVLDTLKIEEPAGASAEASAPFRSHKPVRTAKVFPYLSYFDRFIYKDWECPQRSFSIPRRFSARYPFEESLLKKWASPLVVDPQCPG